MYGEIVIVLGDKHGNPSSNPSCGYISLGGNTLGKWCVLAGSSDTHAVCVCTIHQNVKLLLEPLNISYQNLLNYIICNTSSKECMIHRCPNCPKLSEQLEKFLNDTTEKDFDYSELTEFSQWTTTDRSTLTTQNESYQKIYPNKKHFF